MNVEITHNESKIKRYACSKAKEYSKLRIIKCQNNDICTKCKKHGSDV